MPLYQYQCNHCGDEKEVLQSMEELENGTDTPVKCESVTLLKCNGKYERLVGGASIGLCDTSWWRTVHGTREELDDPADSIAEVYRDRAKKAGVSTTGKVYLPMLAKDVGDPEAWVGSLGDIQQVCKRRGWEYRGVKDGNLDIRMHMDMSKTPDEQIPVSKVGT